MKKWWAPVVLACCMMYAPSVWSNDNTPIALTKAKRQVMSEFDRLDEGLKHAAARLGTSGLTGAAARETLAKLCASFGYAVDCAAIDTKGIMQTLAPAAYRRYEGADISSQEQVRRMMQGRVPLLSSVFMSVEGFAAVDAEYPVTAPDGSFLGSVSLLFKPEKFLGDMIRPLVQGMPMDVWAMEKGGLILYDADPPQIGLNLFRSPRYEPYPSLLELGRIIAREPSGEGTYTFPDRTTKKAVVKTAYWQTVSIYGTDWRLVAIHVEPEKTGPPATRANASDLERRLAAFAENKTFVTALVRGRNKTARAFMKKFHKETPNVYAIQWIDSKGVSRFGYPGENSLKNYDFRTGRMQGDAQMLKAVEEKKPTAFDLPLFEGNLGRFTLKPVFSGKRYLGMVSVIVLKK
jgi:hypothetical protein